MAASNPPRWERLGIALAIGVASGLFTWTCFRSGTSDTPPSDFAYWWTAARILAHGGDPYALHPGSEGWPLPDPFNYPLPALFTIPEICFT